MKYIAIILAAQLLLMSTPPSHADSQYKRGDWKIDITTRYRGGASVRTESRNLCNRRSYLSVSCAKRGGVVQASVWPFGCDFEKQDRFDQYEDLEFTNDLGELEYFTFSQNNAGAWTTLGGRTVGEIIDFVRRSKTVAVTWRALVGRSDPVTYKTEGLADAITVALEHCQWKPVFR